MRTKQEYLLSIPFEYIIGFSKETRLIRCNRYFTKKDFVHRLLKNLNTSECKQLYGFYRNGYSYKRAVEWFLGNYPTGAIVSRNFVDYLNSKKENIGTLCFEFSILKTRVDILRLENRFHAYEVKSQRDRIDRLHYQLPALKEFFEYVSLIVPYDSKRRVIEMVGREVGIFTFTFHRNQMIFEIQREPEMNDGFNEYSQLKLLRICELRDICIKTCRTEPKQKTRKEMIKIIVGNFEHDQINEIFKSKIRNREKTQTRMSILTKTN